MNTSSQVSYTKFELIMKLIGEQSFNPLAPNIERIKMFIIHIRNYVKMHYQISLSINSKKKVLLETQEVNKSASPVRHKNNSYKTLSRTNSISKGKITEVLQNNWMQPGKKLKVRKESPIIPHVHLLLTQKIGKLNSLNSTQSNEIITDRRKNQRSNSSAACKVKNIEKLMCDSFLNFKNRHTTYASKAKPRENLIKKHEKYIANVRNSLFSPGFIKNLIFQAWKAEIRKKCSYN